MTGLSSEQLAFFHAEGYVHVPDALTPEDLDPVQAELEEKSSIKRPNACWPLAK